MQKPSCTILAGPNGSGKTSIYRELQPIGEFINADDIEKKLRQESNIVGWDGFRVQAGRAAIKRINELIENQRDFVLETTLSGQHPLGVMRRAKAAGYNVGFIFVIVDSPSTNIARVQFRVRDGGHHIPAEDIYRRYKKSLGNLATALKIADESVIIDNSPKKPLFLFEKGEELVIKEYDNDIELHRRLIVIVDRAFSEELERKKNAPRK